MADYSDWIFLGSTVDCEIRVTESNVSAYHARCRMEANGSVRIEDMGSSSGTSVNQPGVRTAAQYLYPHDTVYLGIHPVAAAIIYEKLRNRRSDASTGSPPKRQATPPPTSKPPTPNEGAQLRFEPGVTVIGRNPDAINKQRIVVDNPLLSRNHAGILRTEGDDYYVWDLNSTYGTFIDSKRVGSRRIRVLPGQVVGLANYRFSLGGEGKISYPSSLSGVGIRVDDVASEVGSVFKKRLNLAGIRLSIEPGTMLALMGSSGAGKTTLLRILAGQTPPKTGSVLLNDLDLYEYFPQLRGSLGYVPQDDILHPQLTVRDAIYFSSRLRLPPDYSSTEIYRRVDQTMTRLGIAGQANVPIGSVVKRGISGGQRKRTSLAMELLPDPSVSLLDEPTSGLSSADTERVIRALRDLADDGKTVIVTIHQPSREVFEMFDRLAIIDNDTVRTSPPPPPQPGRMIFLGPSKSAVSYFQSQDASRSSLSRSGADAIFTAIDQNPSKTTTEWEVAFHNSTYFRQYVEKPFAARQTVVSNAGASPKANTLPSAFHQLSTLLQRLWRIKTSDQWSFLQMLVLQPLLVAVGIALASGSLHTESSYFDSGYIKDFLRVGKTLFFAVFTAIWFGCNNTAREIVGEIATYRRERMVGLNLGAYLGSKMIFFSLVCAVQCLILASVASLGTNLKANLLLLIFLLWLASVCGAAIGLLISSLSWEGERAIQLVPLVLLPMILFGGGVTRLVDLDTEFARQIATITPARWAFEATLLAENRERSVDLQLPTAGESISPKFTIVHHYFQKSRQSDTRIWNCATYLAISILVFVALACLRLATYR